MPSPSESKAIVMLIPVVRLLTGIALEEYCPAGSSSDTVPLVSVSMYARIQ
jgi:hypothetical protein